MMSEALEDWNPWWYEHKVDERFKGKDREILKEIEGIVGLNKVKIITGVRRAGKSTLLYQIIDKLLKRTRVENILLLNFDDVRLSMVPLEELYKEYIELKKPSEIFLFLDEVHNAKDWVSLVRRLIDLKKANVFVTDSSSYFIPIDYARILTGRKFSLELYPLSFREFLFFKGEKISYFGTEEKARIRGYLREFMEQGGFPELCLTPKDFHRKILSEYFEDIITKDIVSRYNTVYSKARDLAYYLLSISGQRITYRKLRNVLGMGLETIQRYMDFLEQVYLVFRVNAYSKKVKDQIIMPKKVYAVDTGIVNAIGFKFSENLGAMLENIIFLELKRRGYNIFYYQVDEREIDFVVKDRISVKSLINVCYDPEEKNTYKREVEELLLGMKEVGISKGYIITWEYEEKIKQGDKEIEFIPAYKWLLSEKI
ncbi:MAG: ATP-binding protein [Candidatus Asgardarchaeia archaeon]